MMLSENTNLCVGKYRTFPFPINSNSIKIGKNQRNNRDYEIRRKLSSRIIKANVSSNQFQDVYKEPHCEKMTIDICSGKHV